MAEWQGWQDDHGWQAEQENRSRWWEGQCQRGEGWRDDGGWQQGEDNRSRGWDNQGWGQEQDKQGWGQEQDDRSPAVAAAGFSSQVVAPQSRTVADQPQSRTVADQPQWRTGVGEQVYDLDFFRNQPLYTHYKEHNVALKFLREQCEEQGLTVMWLDEAIPIPMIDHPKGTSFSFDYTRTRLWAWQQMVAQLHEDSMRLVVEGSGINRSRGIIGCSLQQTDAYDHKRHHADKKNGTEVEGKMYHIWDFVLTRDDHSYVALHPNYSNTKVECKVHWPRFDGELPATGKGGTSGPGTFSYFIKKDVDTHVRFDANKLITGTGKGAGARQEQGPAAHSWQ